MRNTRIILFIVVAVAQLFVAGKMIFDRQHILNSGDIHLFLMEPVDPNDPFRGKYLTLSFQADYVDIGDSLIELESGQEVVVILGKDQQGYTELVGISSDAIPGSDYLRLKVEHINRKSDGSRRVYFQMPFDRYYLNERKVKLAEDQLREALSDNADQPPYALVRIQDGQAVLQDLMLGDNSISELLNE